MTQPYLWQPDAKTIQRSNLHALMQERGASSYDAIHAWSVNEKEAFWKRTIDTLGIVLKKPYDKLLDDSQGVAQVKWLAGAQMNIADSCFKGPRDRAAIITKRQDGTMEKISLDALDRLSNKVANGLVAAGFHKGDAIAVDMAMTAETVALYLGIIKMGGAVVSIPESFPPEEISKRLRISGAKAVFTQETLQRGGKELPMYDKIIEASAPRAMVLGAKNPLKREGDMRWEELVCGSDQFQSVACSPQDTINVLFSSGTTGDPKAIPWDHTAPIKCASDGHYHQDIHADDVVCWPSSLGWMMGPWLVFASLINNATMAIYEGTPTERGFCEFVQDAKVNMLGLVPSIVKAWRATGAADDLDWSSLHAFSSSGEASSARDYAWLMHANQPEGVAKPVIEYCGGTEIAGGYIANQVIGGQNPSEFNGKAMGSDFVVLDSQGQPAKPGEAGEVFVVPPSIGLSTRLLNADNDKVYYQGCPTTPDGKTLRRHGDWMIVREDGRFQSDGRADNTMNLGGIKTGSTEIERVVNKVQGVVETAAIGVPPPGGGPDRLVIYAVLERGARREIVEKQMQEAIKTSLNPLFKLHEVVPIDALPRTASQKVMHRELRAKYRENEQSAGRGV